MLEMGEMGDFEMPSSDQNWKIAIGFVIGVMVTLIIIVILANKYGQPVGCPAPSLSNANAAAPPSNASAAAPAAAPEPSEPQLELPEIDDSEEPSGSGGETYMPSPF
jgi:hypothetical protein